MDWKDDPRVVTMEHGGETLRFWWHRRAVQTAKDKHGYEPPEVDEEKAEEVLGGDTEYFLRQLWIAHLSFEPDMTFEDFDMKFLSSDYRKLGKALAEIQDKQFPKIESEPVKNAEAQDSEK